MQLCPKPGLGKRGSAKDGSPSRRRKDLKRSNTSSTRFSRLSHSENSKSAREIPSRFNWRSLAADLRSDERSDLSVLAAISRKLSTGCVLHEAISFGAPDEILLLLARRFPALLSQVDDRGWLPIHAACAFGASCNFVSQCISTDPSSADAEDIEGRSPVHLLCRGTWRGRWNVRSNPNAEENMMNMLRLLYQIAPLSIISEDEQGIGPIEYALRFDLGSDFVKLLQQMSVVAHRRLRRGDSMTCDSVLNLSDSSLTSFPEDDLESSQTSVMKTNSSEIEGRYERVRRNTLRKEWDALEDALYLTFGC